MNIIVIARTLNEYNNVDRFCNCYQWATKILIADGGSSDDTVSQLQKWNKVQIRTFFERKPLNDGTFYNPRGKHVNFLIDWANEEGADWIIFDDFDCVPTLDLQLHGKNLLEQIQEPQIFAYRMFVLGQDRWFPEMNKPGQSLWAWKTKSNNGSATSNVRADESTRTLSMIIPETSSIRLQHPYALLHYFYPDEKTHQRKKQQYIQTGEANNDYDPMNQFGPIEQLPEWANWRKENR